MNIGLDITTELGSVLSYYNVLFLVILDGLNIPQDDIWGKMQWRTGLNIKTDMCFPEYGAFTGYIGNFILGAA